MPETAGVYCLGSGAWASRAPPRPCPCPSGSLLSSRICVPKCLSKAKTRRNQGDLTSPSSHLQRPDFQIRSHSRVLGSGGGREGSVWPRPLEAVMTDSACGFANRQRCLPTASQSRGGSRHPGTSVLLKGHPQLAFAGKAFLSVASDLFSLPGGCLPSGEAGIAGATASTRFPERASLVAGVTAKGA